MSNALAYYEKFQTRLKFFPGYEETSSEDPNTSSDPYYNPYDPYNQQSVDPSYQTYPTSGRKFNGFLNLKRIGNAVESLWSKASNALNRFIFNPAAFSIR